MLIDAVNKFLLKHISDKGIVALYDKYLSIVKNNNNLICDQSVLYLKKFVNHSPFDCIRIIRAKENNHFSLLPWGEEYVHLLSLIAAYYLDQDEITEGILWADKAIEMIDFFAPTLKKEIREEVLYNLPASSMVCAYPKQYINAPCNTFYLDWQVRMALETGNVLHHNDNAPW